MKSKVINFVTTKNITIKTFFIPLINKLIDENYKINIICSDSYLLKKTFKKNANLAYYNIDFPKKLSQLFNLFFLIKFLYTYFKLINKLKNNYFYSHTPIASNFLRIIAFLLNDIKIIYHVHGFRFHSNAGKLNNLLFKTLEKLLSTKTNYYLTINNEDYRYAKNYFKNKAALIKGVGVDFEKIDFQIKNLNSNNIDKNFNKNTIIGIIGAYKKNKGWDDILKLAEFFKDEKIIFQCYGYGNNKKYTSKLKNLKKNVFLNKFTDNIYEKMFFFDLYINPSKREGLPVSVMESMYLGIPIIATNIRGNRDLIKHNYNGYLYENNNVEQLYLLVKKILNNKNICKNFKNINRKIILENYNRKVLTEEIFLFLNNIL